MVDLSHQLNLYSFSNILYCRCNKQQQGTSHEYESVDFIKPKQLETTKVSETDEDIEMASCEAYGSIGQLQKIYIHAATTAF